jgi:neutral trehalase
MKIICSSVFFTPLFAGIPSKEQAATIINTMMTKFGGDDMYLCASFDPTSERFNQRNIGEGPVWINLNWILYNGLKDYGYDDIAARVKADSIEILTKVVL